MSSITQRIEAQQTRLLYAQASLGALTSMVIAPILAWILWDGMDDATLLTWLILLETSLLVRLLLAVGFRRCTSAEQDARRWANRYMLACAATGACWGGAVVLLMESASLVYDAFIALILGGVLMAGVLTMTPVLRVYLAYALLLIVPPLLWLVTQDDDMHIAMGATGVLYLLLAIWTAHRYSATLIQSLGLALTNSELAQSCALAQQQAEEHCRRLAEALKQQASMSATAQRQQTLLAHAARLNTLGEMASGLVHEINQPMTAINLYAEACLTQSRQTPPDMPQIQDALQKILVQNARVSSITHKIRRFVRQSKPHYACIQMHQLVEEIADFLHLEARHRAIALNYDVAQELPPVVADGLQIQQVLLNLVRNAIDAMSDIAGARVISISAQVQQELLEVTVSDTGPGLQPEVLDNLLNPFFTTKPSGLGLGLSISQTIISTHGGQLWATTELGAGTTFHFTLPLARHHDPTDYQAFSIASNLSHT